MSWPRSIRASRPFGTRTSDFVADSTLRAWKQRLAPYERPDVGRASMQLTNTLLPFALGFVVMLWSLEVSYLLTLLLALPMAGLYTRIFLLMHDCAHGSFFPSRRANRIVGSLLGVVMMTPFHYWRRAHGMHHAHHGDLESRELGDIVTLTVREYLDSPWWQRLGYRLYRNPLLAAAFGPTFLFVIKHRFPWDAPLRWRREWRNVAFTNVALATILLLAHVTIGVRELLLVQGPIFLIAGAIGLWLLWTQHQFEDCYWTQQPEWSFEKAALHGSAFLDLPPIFRWFTCNIGYHHVHHLSARIPNYHLRECMEAIPELQSPTRITWRDSVRCAFLALWDEDTQQMIRFDQLDELSAARATS